MDGIWGSVRFGLYYLYLVNFLGLLDQSHTDVRFCFGRWVWFRVWLVLTIVAIFPIFWSPTSLLRSILSEVELNFNMASLTTDFILLILLKVTKIN